MSCFTHVSNWYSIYIHRLPCIVISPFPTWDVIKVVNLAVSLVKLDPNITKEDVATGRARIMTWMLERLKFGPCAGFHLGVHIKTYFILWDVPLGTDPTVFISLSGNIWVPDCCIFASPAPSVTAWPCSSPNFECRPTHAHYHKRPIENQSSYMHQSLHEVYLSYTETWKPLGP